MTTEITITVEDAAREAQLPRHIIETIMKKQPGILPTIEYQGKKLLTLSSVINLRDNYTIHRGTYALRKNKGE